MVINSAGKVGIGETDPETSLHIKNSGNSFLTLERSGTTGGTGKFGINMEGGSSQQTTMAYDDGGKLVIGRSSDPATQAGFSNDFIFDSSGNFGIGITPGAKFQVNSSGTIGWSNLANAFILAGTTTSGIGIDNNEIMAKGSGHLYFGTADAGADVIIRAGGTAAAVTVDGSNQRVGIGTDSPAAKLHVYGGTDANLHLRSASQRSGAMIMKPGTNTIMGSVLVLADESYRLGTASNYHIRMNQNGVTTINEGGNNVGIGTTSPASKFQVGHGGIDTYAVNTSATSAAQVDTFSASTFRSARFTVQITNTTDDTYQITEILLIHDGTTPAITEYGTIFTGSAREASFDADIVSGNVRLLATPASTDTMQFKVVRHSILV